MSELDNTIDESQSLGRNEKLAQQLAKQLRLAVVVDSFEQWSQEDSLDSELSVEATMSLIFVQAEYGGYDAEHASSSAIEAAGHSYELYKELRMSQDLVDYELLELR